MKFVDEFRDPDRARALAGAIREQAQKLVKKGERPLQLMEFCGGHTHTIFRYGIEQLLPEEVELVHGPGCPVCVLPMGRVDDCVALAERPDVIFTTFGDAMRVPGSKKSLLRAKADGADVRMVYSPLDALQLARTNPDRQVIFFALGFETTMPSTALTVLQAAEDGLDNFSLFCNHITTVPTMALPKPPAGLDSIAPGGVWVKIHVPPTHRRSPPRRMSIYSTDSSGTAASTDSRPASTLMLALNSERPENGSRLNEISGAACSAVEMEVATVLMPELPSGRDWCTE